MSPMMRTFWPVPGYVLLSGIAWDEAALRGYVTMGALELYGLAWLTGILLFANTEYCFAVWPMVQHRARLLLREEPPAPSADDLKELPRERAC